MTELRDFARAAARRYLQSVVFVDDEIYTASTGRPVDAPDVLSKGMRVFKANEASDAPPISAGELISTSKPPLEHDHDDTSATSSYHPKQLVESFAKERIVCALYEPTKGFATDPDSELFKLCERADVVILDWDLYNEGGQNVLPLITNLVNQSQSTVPHHVRLCVIYTMAPDLRKVASCIYDHLREAQFDVDPVQDISLLAGTSKIVVLGKPSIGRPEELKNKAEVPEVELAMRIIEEFAAMHEGILPSIALHNVGSIRSSTKKILDKFQRDMDGAFLVHRALILPGDDAFSQLPELVAEEILAVMYDDPVPDEQALKLAHEIIDAADIKLELPQKNGREPKPKGQIAVGLLKNGSYAVRADFKEKDAKGLVESLHTVLGATDRGADKRLAALFNVRTQYSRRRPLTFGTIVREKQQDGAHDYYICLMPLCDSVRLSTSNDKTYGFPFWKLSKKAPGAGSSRGLVVELPDGDFAELFAMGKPRDNLHLGRFTASEGGVVLALEKNDRYFFSDGEREWQWVAQLKPSHAQRIAQDIGQSFSRVGVVEAEWLRRRSERMSPNDDE